jgi:DNA invertase Pin-like site-specific DNA recombinase
MPNKPLKTQRKIGVIYARYSSHNQRDVSIEQQVKACRKYAKEKNIEVIQVYDDHAMTGTNDNRPEFQQMIRDSASCAFDYVIVYTLDRFSRNKYDSAIHKHTLKENGVKVLSAMENISDDPTGVLMESVLEGFAEYYSRELAQKIRRGMVNNAEKCMVIGPLPLGYKKGADGRFEILPEEAKIVEEIFRRVANHEMFVSIFNDLNNRGILTKKGKPWDRSSLSKILHNEKYIGVYRYSDIVIEDGIPPIIEKPLFEAVQERCATKPNARGNPQKRRRENGVYLLTGKLYCGECESPMVGVSGTSRTGDLHFYYSCKTRREHKGTCCKRPVSRDYAELKIAEKIQEIISQDSVMAWLGEKLEAYFRENQETDEIRMLKERLNKATREKENTLKAIRNGVTVDCVQDMLMEIQAEESSVRAKLELAIDRSKSIVTREHMIGFAKSLCSGDIHEKDYQEMLFDAFLVRAYLFEDRVKIILNCTGAGTNEIEIPFDIKDIEGDSPGFFEVEGVGGSADVRIKSADLHHSHFIRTTAAVYMICGLVVLVSKISDSR